MSDSELAFALQERIEELERALKGRRKAHAAADKRIKELEAKSKYKDEVIEQRNAECSRQFKQIERLTAVATHAARYRKDPSWQRHGKNLDAALAAVAGKHPFPKDFDALDLAVERNKALLAENERLRALLERVHDLIKRGLYHAADAELTAAVEGEDQS